MITKAVSYLKILSVGPVWGSNPRPAARQSGALPTELTRQRYGRPNPVDSVIFFLSFAFYVSASVKRAQENSNVVMEKRCGYAKAYNYEETVSG